MLKTRITLKSFYVQLFFQLMIQPFALANIDLHMPLNNPETGSQAWARPEWGFLPPTKIPARVAKPLPHKQKASFAMTNHPLSSSLIFPQPELLKFKQNTSNDRIQIPTKSSASLPAKELTKAISPPSTHVHSQILKTEKTKDVEVHYKKDGFDSMSYIKSGGGIVIDLSPTSKVVLRPALVPAAKATTKEPSLAPAVIVAKTESTPRNRRISNDMSANSAASTLLNMGELPKAIAERGTVLVLDADSFKLGQRKTIPQARIFWIAPQSGIQNVVGSKGYVRVPYPMSHSVRFFVSAPNYVPAMGYAVAGTISPVFLVQQSTAESVMATLKIANDSSTQRAFGVALESGLQTKTDLQVELSSQGRNSIFYAAGKAGLFHPSLQKTGESGEFFLGSIKKGVEYIMPSTLGNAQKGEEAEEWPALLADFSHAPNLLSLVIQKGHSKSFETQVVDSLSKERPETGIHVSVGGLSGLNIPNPEGFLKLNSIHKRSAIDLLEVSAQGYQKTWVSSIANLANFPDSIVLFSLKQLRDMFQGSSYTVEDSHQGMVFGILRPDIFKTPQRILIYSSDGRLIKEAQSFYFSSREDEGLNPRLSETDPEAQSFVITQVPEGEHHVFSIDSATNQVSALQIVRVQSNTLSELQF